MELSCGGFGVRGRGGAPAYVPPDAAVIKNAVGKTGGDVPSPPASLSFIKTTRS